MYLIIGGSGFLGRYLINKILEFTDEYIVATYLTNKPLLTNERIHWFKCDVTSDIDVNALNSVIDKKTKVIYLSSYHHPDKVEENPKIAWNINITALANVVNVLTKSSCFFYASTDSVYGEGTVDYAFKENDLLNPVNLYGKHKALAEQIVLASGGNVVRFPFIIGKSLVEHKKHFFDNIYDNLQQGQCIKMFEDSYRSTLSFNQCANLLIRLMEKFGSKCDPIINIASDSPLSKYQVGLQICKNFGFDNNLILPISIESSSGIFKAKRASTTIMDNTKLKEMLDIDKLELEF